VVCSHVPLLLCHVILGASAESIMQHPPFTETHIQKSDLYVDGVSEIGSSYSWQESLMMDKIGDDVVCPDLPFAPITVGGRGGKGKQMQALLQLLQVPRTSPDFGHKWGLGKCLVPNFLRGCCLM
jgi:hypothetical protein